ncbi:ABC transporter ATP-binding protein [Paenibacillus sp. JSM ZJ436]|uniref:ABC transporter ATP-binding protein n=1 Tax=Paenibacillus sp. JSM ZJ436 TaxID=3376190 RepID=UPI0037AA35EB
MNVAEWVIETKGLTKMYKKRAVVDQVNLQIAKGDIYGFLGPNGAGKTTTIRMLLGLIQPTHGVIEIFGRDLKKEKLTILRRTGSLVESPSYYGHLSAVENLEALRRILAVPKQRIDEVLDMVSLTREAKRPVKGYSLGMKQRLGIAASLLGSPELLILDEPTNGLDPAGIQEIRELIVSMPLRYGVTVLVSSHLLSEIELMAGRVGIIREGKLVYQDTVRKLVSQASEGFTFSVSDPEDALGLALKLGCRGRLRAGMLDLAPMPDVQVADVVRQLVEQHHMVYRVEEKRRSLEDIFMEIVGKGNSL